MLTSDNLWTSDLHLGHKAIVKYRSNFKTMKEHDDFIIEKIINLSKKCVLHILGDFLFDGPHYNEYIERLSKKKCRIKLIMGNHDSLKLYKEDIFELQLPLYSYKGIWISHAPIHPQELKGRDGNIHGHLHKEKLKDKRYFNVNIDVNNFEFVPLNTIKNYFEKNKKNKIDLVNWFNKYIKERK